MNYNFLRKVFKIPLVEKWLAELTCHRNKESFIARLPPNYTEYKQTTVRKARRNGINYSLDISDYMEWLVFFGIQYEPRASLYNLAKKDNIVFDIGTNIGEVAMNLAQVVGENGCVHAFEPNPITLVKLKKNLSLNNPLSIIVNEFGLGHKPGKYFMELEVENNFGGARIVEAEKGSYTIKVSTIDEYVSQQKLENINLIKIDVEGFELNVLKGGLISIEKYRPKLYVEVSDRNLRQQSSSAKELVKFIAKYYNKIFISDINEPLDLYKNLNDCHFDLIAINEK